MSWLDAIIRCNLQQAVARQAPPAEGRRQLLQAARLSLRPVCTRRPSPARIHSACINTLRDQARFAWSTRIACWMMDTGVIL